MAAKISMAVFCPGDPELERDQMVLALRLNDGEVFKTPTSLSDTTIILCDQTENERTASLHEVCLANLDDLRAQFLADRSEINSYLKNYLAACTGVSAINAIACLIDGTRLYWVSGIKATIALMRSGQISHLARERLTSENSEADPLDHFNEGVVSLLSGDMLILSESYASEFAEQSNAIGLQELANLEVTTLARISADLITSTVAKQEPPKYVAALRVAKRSGMFSRSRTWLVLGLLSWLVFAICVGLFIIYENG